jgi:hypothetical protein
MLLELFTTIALHTTEPTRPIDHRGSDRGRISRPMCRPGQDPRWGCGSGGLMAIVKNPVPVSPKKPVKTKPIPKTTPTTTPINCNNYDMDTNTPSACGRVFFGAPSNTRPQGTR